MMRPAKYCQGSFVSPACSIVLRSACECNTIHSKLDKKWIYGIPPNLEVAPREVQPQGNRA